MAEEAVERITVAGSAQACFAVAADFGRYPEWATDVIEAEVLETDDQGRATRTRFAVSALGQTIGYVLNYDYGASPAELSWTLAESKMMTTLDGSYRFEADGDLTRVTYRLLVDLALPLPGFMKRKAAETIIETALKQFKVRVEAA